MKSIYILGGSILISIIMFGVLWSISVLTIRLYGIGTIFTATDFFYKGCGFVIFGFLLFWIIKLILSRNVEDKERIKGYVLCLIYFVILSLIYLIYGP